MQGRVGWGKGAEDRGEGEGKGKTSTILEGRQDDEHNLRGREGMGCLTPLPTHRHTLHKLAGEGQVLVSACKRLLRQPNALPCKYKSVAGAKEDRVCPGVIHMKRVEALPKRNRVRGLKLSRFLFSQLLPRKYNT